VLGCVGCVLGVCWVYVGCVLGVCCVYFGCVLGLYCVCDITRYICTTLLTRDMV